MRFLVSPVQFDHPEIIIRQAEERRRQELPGKHTQKSDQTAAVKFETRR
jgi:hypothetical protein